MKKETEQLLYRIDRTALKGLDSSLYVMFILALIAGVHLVLRKCGIRPEAWSVWAICIYVYKGAWIICGCIAGLGLILRIVLSPFVKSDEQEEFEKQVDFILQQKPVELQQTAQEHYSPLHDLTPEQEAAIISLLHDLPGSSRNAGSIHLANISRYLTALDQLGKANLTDKHALRLWVKKVTGKEVPDSSHFNEAIPNNNRKELVKIRTQLEHLLKE